MITAPLLVKALRCTPALAERFAGPLTDACRVYEINTAARLAAFLAQIGHESGALRYTAEIWGPTPAQQRYEGRSDLGNTEPGDGSRYRGRGLIQTTGRANYRRLTQRLRTRGVDCPDFEADPEELTAPWWAALSAADYWDMRGCNALADAGDFIALTKRINGGTNGLADRQARLQWARDALEGIDVAPLLLPLAGAVIDLFAPLAKEKLQGVLSKHGADPTVAEPLVASVIEAAKVATGMADPIQAVAAVQNDPEKLRAVESAALSKLSDLMPMIDKLAEIEQRDREADESSRDAAARRAAAEPWDMTRTLVYGAFGMLALLILLVASVAMIQLRAGAIASEVWAQVAGLIGFATGVGVTIYAYRFGTSKSSQAKDVLISSMADRR